MLLLALGCLVGTILLAPVAAHAAVTSVTPITWNIVGLDSNTPGFGPNRFPVGARVCSDSAGSVSATFNWDSSNPYIDLSSSSPNPVTLEFTGAGCLDAYFEVEVQKTAAAFDTTRQFHISAGGRSTPTPRELYVEHLVSQARNAISNLEYRRYDGTGTLPWTSVAAGGSFALVKDETYEIRMSSYTATQGYEQLESFSTLPNTIFQLLAVNTTYSADTSAYVSNPNDKLYADGCFWENDPNSPIYRECRDVGKAGGTLQVTYRVKILAIPGGGAPIDLLSLIYDFSGSSFHYNSDYNSGGRSILIIDPTSATIAKSFFPTPVNVGGVSTLTFTLSNPNAAPLSGANFTDTLPTSMVVASPTGASTSNCGTPTFAPTAGATSLSFSNGTIPASGSCTVKVNVTVPGTGTYNNDSNNLFIGTTDTGDDALASLVADTTSFPPADPPSSCSGQEVTLATWTFNNQTAGALYGSSIAATTLGSDVSAAAASYNAGTGSASGFADATTAPTGWSTPPASADEESWGIRGGWPASGPPTAATTPGFQFRIDTAKYGGLVLSANYNLRDNWSNGDSYYIFSSNDGSSWNSAGSAAWNKQNNWYSLASTTPQAGTAATSSYYFRVSFPGAQYSGNPASTGATAYLDNVTIRGCRRPDAPTLTKGFSPNPVKVNGTSTLTFTVTNPNSGYSLSGIQFSDTLPAGLTVASGSSSQCGGTLTTTAPSTIAFTGGSLASGSCTITATVTATTAGPHENVSGIVSATQSGPNNTSSGIATANLIAVNPPAIAKKFGPNPILAGGVSKLTFTITNPNPSDALSGVAFADTFPTSPASMLVAATPNAFTSGCGTPTFAPTSGAASISFSGGTIAGGGTCTVTVDVTAPALGDYANTSGNVSHVINSETVTGNTASDTLTVTTPSPAIALLKQVGKAATGPWSSFVAVTAGASVYYRLTVENAGDVPLASVSVSDPLVNTAGCSWQDGDGAPLTAPFTLPVADADNGHLATCTLGPVTAAAGTHSNTATASGSYGGTSYTDSSTARYATTALTLIKSAAEPNFSAADDVLHYSYVLTNTGNAPLAGPAAVADDKSSDESCPAVSTAVLAGTGPPPTAGDGDNYLDPGEQITCTATYTVVAADVLAGKVTNTATATIGGVTSPVATKTVLRNIPSLLFMKTAATVSDPVNGASGPKAIPGAWVDYTLTVSNFGGGAIDDDTLAITDPIPTNTQLFVQGRIDATQDSPVAFSDPAPDNDSGFVLTGTSPDLVPPFTLGFYTDAACTTAAGPLNPDTDGFDAAIRCLKITMDGIMNGATDETNPPDFSLTFRVRID